MTTKTAPKRTKTEILREQIRVQAEITRRECRASFYSFFLYFWDSIVQDPLINNFHIRKMCTELQEIGERVINRERNPHDTIFNVPPGTSKSTIVTIMWPAWLWLRDASIRVINASYSQDVAMEHAVKTRDVLQSLKFTELYGDEITFKSDQNNKTRYENTKGGTRTCCGVGGTITSKHAHVLIGDDLINPKQSHSDTIRLAAVVWMDGTFSTRKVDKVVATTVLVMQRLHELDPTGHLLQKAKDKGKKIKHICMPGEIIGKNIQPKPIELKKYYKGGLLDTKRMDRGVLDDMKIDLGDDDYAGQVLQSPMPPGGNIIKREWIKGFTELPKEKPISIIQSWDTAYKKQEQNAWQCCGTWKEYQNGFYLDHVFVKKLIYPELKQMVIALDAEFKPHETLIEDKSSGTPIVQELEIDTRINFVKILPELDKVSRAHAASSTFRAGNVYIRTNAEWSRLVIEQLTMFPNCRIKDIMDMVSQYINYIRSHQVGDLSKMRGGSDSGITEGY